MEVTVKRNDNRGTNGGNRKRRIENIVEHLYKGESSYRAEYRGALLSARPGGPINVLPQPRKTFANIAELSLDVAKKKLLNPPTVARFSRESCERYVEVVNELWGTNFTISDLRATREGNRREVFYVLLAGERRLRACQLLWKEGCEGCRERYGLERPGICFRRHFAAGKIEVRLCVNIPALAALFLQLSENTHVPVAPYEEAYAYGQLFKLIRRADETFSIARFAREVGRSPDTVRNAIRFYELPRSIQEPVEKRIVPYGIAVQIARLGVIEEEGKKEWMLRAILNRWKVTDCANVITKYLEEKASGQTSLLDIMTASQAALAKPRYRDVVAKDMIQTVYLWTHYFERALRLFREGMVGKENSPFSEGSPVRMFKKHISLLEELLVPHLRDLISKRDAAHAATVLTEANVVLEELETASVSGNAL